MEYTFLEYFYFCLVKLIFWCQFCRNPQLYLRRHIIPFDCKIESYVDASKLYLAFCNKEIDAGLEAL